MIDNLFIKNFSCFDDKFFIISYSSYINKQRFQITDIHSISLSISFLSNNSIFQNPFHSVSLFFEYISNTKFNQVECDSNFVYIIWPLNIKDKPIIQLNKNIF